MTERFCYYHTPSISFPRIVLVETIGIFLQTYNASFQVAKGLAKGQVANDIEREEHKPLGHVCPARLPILVRDPLDRKPHFGVNAWQECLEAGLGHGVREQSLILSVYVWVDGIKDTRRVSDELLVEG